MAKRKLSVNDAYFESIDTPQKAYWLGFIAADGCVSSTKNAIVIALQQQDKCLLEQFKQDICFSGEVKDYNNKYNVSKIYITSKKMKEDLSKWGIVPRKTNILTWPDINQNFYPDFIRGYFDGDGSWSVRVRGNCKDCIFQIVSGAETFLKHIETVLRLECGFEERNLCKMTNTNCYELKYSGNGKAMKLYDFLYRPNSFYLERKFNKVTNIIENKRKEK
jgi:hypothetical protein